MKVTVKPVPSEKWHGKEGKESFAQPLALEVLYDPQTGAYATGLTEEEALKYGKLLGADLSDTYSVEEPHPYWSSSAAKIKLPNHTLMYETDKPDHYVKVKNLKASSSVANSLKEWEEGLWPEATHYIYDESEEVQASATKIQKRNRCIERATKMTLDERLSVVQILSNKALRGRSSDFVDVEIDKIIEEDADGFLNLTKQSKEQVYARGVIMEAIYKHKLIKDGLKITYMGETVGHDIDQAVDYFLDPDNQAMKVAILEKILN